jgi:hypothetical protein
VGFAVLLAVRFGQSEGGNAVLTTPPTRRSPRRPTDSPSWTGLRSGLCTQPPSSFIIIVWLGMWGARRRLLEDVATHRRLLQRVAAICLAITVAGAVPYALVAADAPRSRPLHDAGDVPTARGQR